MQNLKFSSGMFFEEFCAAAGHDFPESYPWLSHVPGLLQSIAWENKIHSEKYRNLVRTEPGHPKKPWVLDLGKGRKMPYSFKGYEVHFVAAHNSYQSLDFVTDYFTEKARMMSRRQNSLAPALAIETPEIRKQLLAEAYRAYAAQSPDAVPEVCLLSKQVMARFFLRRAIYTTLKECGNFKVSFAAHIFKYFKSTRVLDPFSGWGDRAIGAGLVPEVIRYVGVDSNPELIEGYSRIRSTFCNPVKLQFLVPVRFEDALLPNIVFDTVIASPPFFDFEIYGNAEPAVITAEQWVMTWLVPCLEKALRYLGSGGHLVLYLCDSHRFAEKRYVGLCHDLLMRRNFQYLDFLGTIATLREKDSRRVMPLFIYRKK